MDGDDTVSLEDRVKRLEELMEKLNGELSDMREKIASLTAKVDLLAQQNEKTFTFLKWIIFILLGIVGMIIGFKVTPPP
jgi:predicted RNase H-like nuclease (RuvC/YqgF family)